MCARGVLACEPEGARLCSGTDPRVRAVPNYDEGPFLRFDDPLVRYDDPRSYQQILDSLNKRMFDVALDIKGLSVPDLIQRAKDIKAGIADNAVFTSLAAKLTALQTAIDTLTTKQTEQQAAKAAAETATGVRDDAAQVVKDKLRDLSKDVGQLAVTPADVESALMRVKGATGPKPVPAQPTGLELKVGDEEGELSGQCNGQPGIVEYYEIQFTTTDPNAPGVVWQFSGTSGKSRFDLENLPTGEKVWVQLRACNARGKSPWSDPACKRVP
jgi:hypothetical protein